MSRWDRPSDEADVLPGWVVLVALAAAFGLVWLIATFVTGWPA